MARHRNGLNYPLPDAAVSDTGVRALAAVMSQEFPTVRSVAEAIDRAVQPTHRQLCILREHGLVDWEDGLQGTLRATCYLASSSA